MAPTKRPASKLSASALKGAKEMTIGEKMALIKEKKDVDAVNLSPADWKKSICASLKQR